MERPVIRKIIRDYYMWKSLDWFQEQGFEDNPLKAYLYAIFILHDTCLSISHLAYYPEPNRERVGLYLRRFEASTRARTIALVRNAIRRFGTEAIKQAIEDKTGIPREMYYMEAGELEGLAFSVLNLVLNPNI